MPVPLVRDLIAEHFKPSALETLCILRQEFPVWMRADVLAEIERSVTELPGTRFTGARLRGDSGDFRFAHLLEEGRNGIAVAPPVKVASGQGYFLLRGLWLCRAGDVPFALLWDVYDDYHGTRLRQEVAVSPGKESEELAAKLMERIRAAGERAESWRGRVIIPSREPHAMDVAPPELRIASIDAVTRDEVVLAPGTLELIERNTLDFARHADALVRYGMSARKGVLLYGPPGTGKTFVVRYLATALKGYTTFLLSAEHLGYLSETVQTARSLAPAMIVVEDVDLIGADRDGPWQETPGALNTLLNAMDGLAPDARILFLLTTNRLEVLEPALAARPGRVDQAIEIGLPEERERTVLLRRYAAGLELAGDIAERTSKKLGKVSGAYIRELMRRAAQKMLERDGNRLESVDLDTAHAEMNGSQRVRGGKIATLARSPGFV